MQRFFFCVLLVAALLQTSTAFFTGTRLFNSIRIPRVVQQKYAPVAPVSMSTTEEEPWPLKSITKEGLFSMIAETIEKQFEFEMIEAKDVEMEDDFIDKYDADSVDMAAMAADLENNFKYEIKSAGVESPAYRLGSVVTVKDLFNVMVDTLKEVEAKDK